MAHIGAFTIINPMEAAKYRGDNNLLSPPHQSSFSLPTGTANLFRSRSRSLTRNPSFPPSATMSPRKNQPQSRRLQEAELFLSRMPQTRPLPHIVETNKALGVIAKSGKYSTALSHFNKLQLQEIELDLYTFNIAINCYCHVNRVGFGFSLLGVVFKRGYTPDVVTVNTLLNGLIEQDKTDEALSLFNKLQLEEIELNLYTFNIAINCYCHVNRVGFGFSLLGVVFKRGYTPDVVTVNTLLNGLISQDKTDEALSLFNKLQLEEIELDLHTFNIAINCYCCVNRVGFGFSLLGSIFKCGYTPDVATFDTLLNGLIIQDKTAEAVELFEKIVKREEIKHNVYQYGSLINGLCKMGNTGAAISFLRIAGDGGLNPDTMTYNMIIDSHCKDRMVEDALNLFREMKEKGVHPNVFTYTSLIDGLCSCGQWKEASRMLGEMLDMDISPDIITFGVLVDALAKEGRGKEAEEAIESSIRRGVHPDVVMYNSLMNGYCSQGQMDEAMRVFNTMVDRGIQPVVRSYNILINGYCKNMEVHEAMRLFFEMEEKGICPNDVTYTTMFNGLFRVGKYAVAQELLNEMELAGLTPESKIYCMLLDGLSKTGHIDEALSLFHMIENKGLGLNVVMYNILIDAFCKNKDLDNATDLFIKLSSQGLQPDFITCNIMIRGLCKEGFLDEAKELLVKMEQNGLLPDSGTYNSIIYGFVEQQK